MAILLEQQISNHPLFPNIKRIVVVYGTNVDGRFEQIMIDADVRYLDENQGGKDVSEAFKTRLENWIVNNSDTTTVIDKKGNPVLNSEYIEAPTEGQDTRMPEQREKWKKAPSFDYFWNIIKDRKSSSLINILDVHIQRNDAIKFFDKMLNLPIEE